MEVLADTGILYDLFVRDAGPARFAWRFHDHGVVVEDDALSITRSGRWMRLPYDSILSVTLSASVIGRSGTIGQCVIQLGNGSRYLVGNTNDTGLADGQRDGPYRLFLDDFHKRLIASGASKRVRFISGYSETRSTVLTIALVLGTALFGVLPLVILAVTRDFRVLGLMLTGGLLLWPAWRMARANRPGDYFPDNPPDLLD